MDMHKPLSFGKTTLNFEQNASEFFNFALEPFRFNAAIKEFIIKPLLSFDISSQFIRDFPYKTMQIKRSARPYSDENRLVQVDRIHTVPSLK